MKDRVALVTGASSGIGAATAELLAREGAIVAAVARRADRLEDLVKRIEAAGGPRAPPFRRTSRASPRRARSWRSTLARHGRIDILVNGAGIVRPGSVETADPAAWREQIDINLLAAMYLSQGVLPGMRVAPRWTHRHGLLHGRPLRGHPPQRLYREQARRECVLRDVCARKLPSSAFG